MAQMTEGCPCRPSPPPGWTGLTHLALLPRGRWNCSKKALGRAADNSSFALRAMGGEAVSPTEGLDGSADKRFADPAWSKFPFNVLARAHQNTQALLKDSVHDVGGLDAYHAQLLDFAVRMAGDASSPANSLA
jgi:polyhydroxyalkanoate synthase